VTIEQWTRAQRDAFDRDGFVVVEEGFVDDGTVAALRERFEPLFNGRYETGIRPDEVNWVPGRDPEDRTRQICNGWKADPRLAAQTLSARTGRLAAELMGWDGVRILQDNVIWKPPGAKSLGMHQDGSYLDYLVPPEMITCWIALDDTSADSGPITYAAGSNRWPRSPENRGEFHAPADWHARAAWPSITSTRSTAPARTRPQSTGARSSHISCRPTPGSIPSTPTPSTRATGASATRRWTSRSSRSCGRGTGTARAGWTN
jgi:hypothetical protein